MNILFTLDRNYLPPLRVMLVSLLMNNPGEEFHIYLAGDGLTQEDILAVHAGEETIAVNLSGRFRDALAALDAAQERAAVYAMVNTLTQFAGTDDTPQRVAFFFDGAQRRSLSGGLDMRGELWRNPGMVVD